VVMVWCWSWVWTWRAFGGGPNAVDLAAATRERC
jgi:hypothetical protein